MGLPDIRYVRNGEVSIAYSVLEPTDQDPGAPARVPDEWRLYVLAAGR